MLSNTKICLRAMELEDTALIKKWRFDWSNYDFFYEFTPVSTHAQHIWMEKTVTARNEMNFIAEVLPAHTPFGMIALLDIDLRNQKAELGRVLVGDISQRGKGRGKMMVQLLCNYAFNHLNLHKVYCEVFADNARALETYLKCGFEQTGIRKKHIYKNGSFKDIVLLEKLNDPR